MKFKVTILCCVFAFAKAEFSNSQNNELGEVLTDMLLISDRYVQPAAEASVMQSSAGWYYSANTLSKYKVTVALHANALVFPSSKKNFEINNDELLNLTIRGDDSTTIPTTLGGEQRTFFDFTIDGEEYEFQAFEGIDTGFLAYPFLQLGVGLWQETELLLRYSPNIKIDKSDYAIYGIGVKHNLSQYLFKGDRPVELAFLTSYSLFDLNLSFNPYELRSDDNSPPLAVIDGSLVDAHAILFQLIASKDYNDWTFSSGVAYNRSWIDYELSGEDGIFLQTLNGFLEILSETQHSYKVDLGATYHFNNWDLSSQLSAGNFINLNIGGVYHIQ
ncbi:hypothetical protein JCM19275_1884 [Nonlabens ulvanivorans]|uniref:Uncharacterized protein n=1 Tax=Nonlabens ulvanivorans TaxID=906888 RepID=A0A090WGW2_NONUL|nr:DUF6588 family protein [Nonlabens ulvanivorans]GAL75433.1 hypothetical protein JCM19275_1884 [Nonlabens ulvanivorans]